MDQTQLQQQIVLYYSKLPEDIQQVFSSMSWMEKIKEISIKFGLTQEQIETLGAETTLALLGIISLDEYQENIANDLRLQSTPLQKMLTEINDSIFKLIRPQLTDAYNNHVESLVDEKYGGVESLDARFSKLPKEVQDAITESNYQNTLYSIGSQYKLSIDQMGALEESTNKVLIGILHPDKYEEDLKAKISLPPDQISGLVKSVNENLLKNIREILKSSWGTRDEGIKSGDDEVPVPPYGQTIKLEATMQTEENPIQVTNSLSKIETGIYNDAGIEFIDESKDISSKPGPSEVGMDIISNKLNKMVMSGNVVSDYSLPKVNKPSTPSPLPAKAPELGQIHDPYHEPIN
jgi:hypothetical protein